MSEVSRVLNAVSGSGDEFIFKDDGSVLGKFVITNTATAVIKIFEVREKRADNCLYKAVCSDWNGATATLHLKTGHVDDSFSATSLKFTEDDAIQSDFR
tara:strand:- start:753 stop:1049 length:297 start_codon:yes stop_codon:yes gene_type:complete